MFLMLLHIFWYSLMEELNQFSSVVQFSFSENVLFHQVERRLLARNIQIKQDGNAQCRSSWLRKMNRLFCSSLFIYQEKPSLGAIVLSHLPFCHAVRPMFEVWGSKYITCFWKQKIFSLRQIYQGLPFGIWEMECVIKCKEAT